MVFYAILRRLLAYQRLKICMFDKIYLPLQMKIWYKVIYIRY